MAQAVIAAPLLAWFRAHGRHDLPWQHPRTPYRVWLAEIMLQQTRVRTVIPYYARFIARFPDITTLAAAPLDDVLTLWSGLGYYARGRNLHRAATVIASEHAGALPDNLAALMALPGIGRSTAAAILAQAFDRRHAILDGNAKRVLARYHALAGWRGDAATTRQLWRLAESHTPSRDVANYTQAIMDLGAKVCTRSNPACELCPLQSDCKAMKLGKTSEIPTPRPRRSLPEKSCVMAIVSDTRGAVLLQRRPPIGIWGGLWCFPQYPDLSRAKQAMRGWARLSAPPLTTLPHTFTHFRLHITPSLWHLRSHGHERINEPDEQIWIQTSELPSVGVPSVVNKLLERITSRQK